MASIFSRRLIIALPVLLLWVLSACQAAATPTPSQPGTDSPATLQEPTTLAAISTPAPTMRASTPTQAASASAIPPAPDGAPAHVNVVYGPGAFTLTETTAGLAGLSSYTASLTLAFDGTQAGKPKKWVRKYVMVATLKPAVRQLAIARTADSASPAQVFLAEADGTAYEQDAGKACIANAIAADGTLAQRFEPAGFLTAVIGADAAGSETVNGAPADHYKFDERALGQTGLAKSTGELWVASQGGYIVRYVETTQGGANFFGEGAAGTLTWDYELTGANQTVTLELPKDCPAGLVNAPLLPDASSISNKPGNLKFKTAASLADAAEFYKKQLPTLGWKAEGEPTVTGTSVLMEFTQAEKTMTVVINTEKGVTNVAISTIR